MFCVRVNDHCHRVTTQLQLISIIIRLAEIVHIKVKSISLPWECCWNGEIWKSCSEMCLVGERLKGHWGCYRFTDEHVHKSRKARSQLLVNLDTCLHKQDSQQKMQSPVSLLHHTMSGLLVLFILMT
jgi:hypothetical protein